MEIKVLESILSRETKEYIKCTIKLDTRFSVTGDIGVIKRGVKRDPIVILGKELEHSSCGCLHQEILMVWPHLEPLVNMHMCDMDGYNTHFLDNGLFLLDPEYMNLQDYPDITNRLIQLKRMKVEYPESYKVESVKFVEEVRPFLKKKADEAKKLFLSL